MGIPMNSAAEVRGVFANCSLIIGLHADQATEPIVDFALAARVPFAVVPCCVHPSAFPHRRIIDTSSREDTGLSVLKPVRSYEDFITYLLAKSPLIRRHDLTIGGRKTVLFVTSYAIEKHASAAEEMVGSGEKK
jgi:hypothetical protein